MILEVVVAYFANIVVVDAEVVVAVLDEDDVDFVVYAEIVVVVVVDEDEVGIVVAVFDEVLVEVVVEGGVVKVEIYEVDMKMALYVNTK